MESFISPCHLKILLICEHLVFIFTHLIWRFVHVLGLFGCPTTVANVETVAVAPVFYSNLYTNLELNHRVHKLSCKQSFHGTKFNSDFEKFKNFETCF